MYFLSGDADPLPKPVETFSFSRKSLSIDSFIKPYLGSLGLLFNKLEYLSLALKYITMQYLCKAGAYPTARLHSARPWPIP
jgi:hypothetical protein